MRRPPPIYTFEWDAGKARSNYAKHRISFELAREAWKDPDLLVVGDRVVDGEERWQAIGRVGVVTVLLVVHTLPDVGDDAHIRIISARRATPQERRTYDEQIA